VQTYGGNGDTASSPLSFTPTPLGPVWRHWRAADIYHWRRIGLRSPNHYTTLAELSRLFTKKCSKRTVNTCKKTLILQLPNLSYGSKVQRNVWQQVSPKRRYTEIKISHTQEDRYRHTHRTENVIYHTKCVRLLSFAPVSLTRRWVKLQLGRRGYPTHRQAECSTTVHKPLFPAPYSMIKHVAFWFGKNLNRIVLPRSANGRFKHYRVFGFSFVTRTHYWRSDLKRHSGSQQTQ
jgi:hypothetical protein